MLVCVCKDYIVCVNERSKGSLTDYVIVVKVCNSVCVCVCVRVGGGVVSANMYVCVHEHVSECAEQEERSAG